MKQATSLPVPMASGDKSGSGPRRPAGSAAWSKVAAVIALSLFTFVFLNWDGRYQPVAAPPLPNLGMENGFRHWAGTPGVVGFVTDSGTSVRLSAGRQGLIPMLLRPVPVDPTWERLRLGADVKLENVAEGRRPWRRAGILLRSFDSRGRRLPHWPFVVARMSGTADWHRLEAMLPLTERARGSVLYIYQGGPSGRLWVRNITIEPVREADWSKAVRAVLVGLWAAVALWVLRSLLAGPTRGLRPIARYATVIVGIGILGGIVSPQPQLSNALTWAGNEVIQATAPLWRGLRPSPDTAAPNPVESPGETEDAVSAVAVAPEGTPESADDSAAATAESSDSKTGVVLLRRQTAVSPRLLQPDDFRRTSLFGFGLSSLAHLLAFALLAFLAVFGFPEARLAYIAAALMVAALAGETLQLFVVTRTPEWFDSALNAVGIVLGVGIGSLIRIWFVRRRTRQPG